MNLTYMDITDRVLKELMRWLDAELRGPVSKLSENTERLSGFLTHEKDVSDLYSAVEFATLKKETLELQLLDDAAYSDVSKSLKYLQREFVKVFIHSLISFFYDK